MKSQSPASNSANSVSPGSSLGGQLQQASNEDADSENDDKEIAQSKGSGPVDILDLLSKAQDKFEKVGFFVNRGEFTSQIIIAKLRLCAVQRLSQMYFNQN